MASEGQIYLGPTGDEELISNYAKEVERTIREQGRSDTVFGGGLKTDITSRKYTFRIPFDIIDAASLAIVYEKYELYAPLNLRMYLSASTYFTNFDGNCPVVKMEPFATTDFITGRTSKIYKNMTLTFLEI